jgi:tRNA (Thr-GGU) A37 N-methylase
MKRDRRACSECGNLVNTSEIIIVDERPICTACFYGGAEPIALYPIGEVRTELRTEEKDLDLPAPGKTSCIDLLPSQEQFMYRLDEEQFLIIVYYLHKSKSVQSIFRRRSNGKKVGVFASRTPHRPSKIAVQDVELLKIRATTLYVSGLDAIEGSPVLDIKVAMRDPQQPQKTQIDHRISKEERQPDI